MPRPSLPEPLAEPLSGSEIRVLRYLPTNLTAPEIAPRRWLADRDPLELYEAGR